MLNKHKTVFKRVYRLLKESYPRVICVTGITVFGRKLYLSMRFLELAFGRMEFRMDLTTRTWGTDGDFCYYNPSYLMAQYEENPVRVNRAFLHMLLHSIFCHMDPNTEPEEELYDLACDIAAESIIDSMEYRSVMEVVRDERAELYAKLKRDMKVMLIMIYTHF